MSTEELKRNCLASFSSSSVQTCGRLSLKVAARFLHSAACGHHLRVSGPHGCSDSVQCWHTHPGCLLIRHNESLVFAVGLRSLLQLPKVLPNHLRVHGLQVRVGWKCLPVVLDLGAWFGRPETQSHRHRDYAVRSEPTEQKVQHSRWSSSTFT